MRMYVRMKGGYGAFPLMTEVTSIHAQKIMNKLIRGLLLLLAAVMLSGWYSAPAEAASKKDPQRFHQGEEQTGSRDGTDTVRSCLWRTLFR